MEKLKFLETVTVNEFKAQKVETKMPLQDFIISSTAFLWNKWYSETGSRFQSGT